MLNFNAGLAAIAFCARIQLWFVHYRGAGGLYAEILCAGARSYSPRDRCSWPEHACELEKRRTVKTENFAESSGDLGYDTGAYNVGLSDRTLEGNYVMVVKRINERWLIVAHAHVPNPEIH